MWKFDRRSLIIRRRYIVRYSNRGPYTFNLNIFTPDTRSVETDQRSSTESCNSVDSAAILAQFVRFDLDLDLDLDLAFVSAGESKRFFNVLEIKRSLPLSKHSDGIRVVSCPSGKKIL